MGVPYRNRKPLAVARLSGRKYGQFTDSVKYLTDIRQTPARVRGAIIVLCSISCGAGTKSRASKMYAETRPKAEPERKVRVREIEFEFFGTTSVLVRSALWMENV